MLYFIYCLVVIAITFKYSTAIFKVNKGSKMPDDLEQALADVVNRPQENTEDPHLREKRLVMQAREGFVQSKDLESTLKEVTGHVVVPKGRYIVDFDIIVKSGAILEIEAGAEFYFGSEAGILSYGVLKAKGTENLPILCTAYAKQDKNPFQRLFARGSWKNIALVGEGAEKSILSHVKVEKGTGRSKAQPYSLNDFHLPEDQRLGGGMMVVQCSPAIEECNLEGNKAFAGGGLYVYKGNPKIMKSRFIRNIAVLDGGGIYLCQSDSEIVDCDVRSNKAIRMNGGGIYAVITNLLVTQSRIYDNVCKEFGGGISINKSGGDIRNTIVRRNRARHGSGGGIRLSDSTTTMTANEISYNSTSGNGGGIDLSSSDCNLSHNQIFSNRAEIGGGISFYRSNGSLSENTVIGNKATSQDPNRCGGGLYLQDSNPAVDKSNNILGDSPKNIIHDN